MKFGTLLIFFTVLYSCAEKSSSTNDVNQEFGAFPQALIDSLDKNISNCLIEEIDPTIDNTIVGKKGTVVMISANSLVDANGKVINDKISIKLKECYDLVDMVCNNLQTISDGRILETRGMLYLSGVTLDGENVEISKSKPIRIEMPLTQSSENAQFFSGTRESEGRINWKVADEPSKKLVPFPIKGLAPRSNFECAPHFGFTQDPEIWKDTLSKYYFTNEDITKYENTIIATREFRDRYYSYCMSDLTSIYLNNLDKNLWEIDELVVDHFVQDSIERVNFYLNDKPTGINGGKATKEQKEAHEWLVNNEKEGSHALIETYKFFASQKLTKIDASKKVDTSKVAEINNAFLSFDAFNFGWVNCDIFYDAPNAKPINFYVETSESPMLVNLIFNDQTIILNGIEEETNRFRFTQKKDGYNKLPVGESAIILAMGYQDGKITFASKRIKLGDKEIESLKLKPLTAAELKTKLEKISS